MKAPEFHQLSQADHKLIGLLFASIDQPDETIDRMRFRATHHDQIATIDQLELNEYLCRDAGRYRISLLGLQQMMGQPQQILLDAEVLWRELRKHYKAELTAMVPLRDLATHAELELVAAGRALTYMLEAPWSAGRSNPENILDVQVAASEQVLLLDTFADQIQQMRRWQSDRIRQRDNVASNRALKVEPGNGKALVREVPPWIDKLPQDARILMREIYAAVDAGTFALPAMGIRAVVDVISMEVQHGDIGSFRKKLDGLRNAGHLTPTQYDALDAVVDAGNAAAHRGFAPDADALAGMLAAVSHLLHTIYVMPETTRLLRAGTPQRHS